MKRSKGLKIVLLLMLALSLVVSACGQKSDGDNQSNNQNNGEQPSGTQKVTLHFWSGIPAENGPQAAVDEWNQNNPNIQVVYTRYVNDDAGNLRVNTALQTREQIDILMSHGVNDYEQRVASGFLRDMSDHVDQAYIDAKIGAGAEKWAIDGKYYTLPTNINAIFLMINEDLLTSKGLDVKETYTWDELQQVAEQLKGSVKYPYAIDSATIHGIIQNAVLDAGFVNEEGKSNLGHPNVRAGLELYNNMMQTGLMPKLAEQISTNMAVEQMFLNGEVGIYQAGAWRLRLSNNLTEYPRDFKIAFAPYPNFSGQSIPAHHVEDAMSIVAESKHPEEAWKFIEWYAKEGMLHLAPGGRVPASVDAPAAEAREQIVQGAEDTYNLESLNRTYEIDNTAMLASPPFQVLDNIQQEIERYFLGGQSVDQAIDNMVKFHNDFLARQ